MDATEIAYQVSDHAHALAIHNSRNITNLVECIKLLDKIVAHQTQRIDELEKDLESVRRQTNSFPRWRRRGPGPIH